MQIARADNTYQVEKMCYVIIYTEMGGIALIVDHQLEDTPDGNFPAKPFFGVDPVILDCDYVSSNS